VPHPRQAPRGPTRSRRSSGHSERSRWPNPTTPTTSCWPETLQAYPRWRNADARQPDVIAAQRREGPCPQRTPPTLGPPTRSSRPTNPANVHAHRT
jgi:hypothetical protein